MNTDINTNTNIKNNSDVIPIIPIIPIIPEPINLQASLESIESIESIDSQASLESIDSQDSQESLESQESQESLDEPLYNINIDNIDMTIINNEEQKLIFNEICPKPLFIIYDENKEIDEETQLLNYHKNKDCGYWKIAKMIIAHSNKDNNNTEFYLDYLDIQIKNNNDELENIEKVFYRNNLDIDIVYEFEGVIAKFIVENLKIFKYKPLGYLFNKDVNQNKWNFTISVITNKNIYTSNRYINENQIGYY